MYPLPHAPQPTPHRRAVIDRIPAIPALSAVILAIALGMGLSAGDGIAKSASSPRSETEAFCISYDTLQTEIENRAPLHETNSALQEYFTRAERISDSNIRAEAVSLHNYARDYGLNSRYFYQATQYAAMECK